MTETTDNNHLSESPGLPADSVSVEVSSEAPDWADFHARHPQATVYNDPRWGEVIRSVYGNEPVYLTARRGGEVVGTLQLVCQKSLLFGSHLCSVPWFDAAGILATDAQARDALLAAAREQVGRRKVDHAEIRQLEVQDESLPTRTDKVTLWLDLPDSEEAMWKQLRSKTRTKVRKVLKNDLSVTFGGGELLGDFHAVYSRTMRDLGSPAHSRRFFEAVLSCFGQQVQICTVRDGEELHAASFAMTDDRMYHVPWSGSLWRYRRSGANRQQFWSMMARAAEGPWEVFDFGRSSKGSGTHEFKLEWNPREVQLRWHFILSEGAEMPQLNPDSGKFDLAMRCWRRLPLSLANFLGPHLIRKLP